MNVSDDVRKEIKDSKVRLTKIELILASRQIASTNELIVSNSPKALSAIGKQLFENSGAESAISEHFDRLCEIIKERNPQTDLDVETISFIVLIEETGEAWFNPIKNYIYNNPKLGDRMISIQDLCFVASFPLRDYYLSKHPF